MKKWAKRIGILLLIGIMALSTMACSKKDEPKEDNKIEATEPEDKQEEENLEEETPEILCEMYAVSKVRVREEASTEAQVFCTLKAGDVVQVVSIGEEWNEILIDGNIYYVAKEYLREKKDNAQKNSYVIAIDAGHQGKGNSEKVNHLLPLHFYFLL